MPHEVRVDHEVGDRGQLPGKALAFDGDELGFRFVKGVYAAPQSVRVRVRVPLAARLNSLLQKLWSLLTRECTLAKLLVDLRGRGHGGTQTTAVAHTGVPRSREWGAGAYPTGTCTVTGMWSVVVCRPCA